MGVATLTPPGPFIAGFLIARLSAGFIYFRFGSRLCENSDFKVGRRIFVSVSSLWEPIAPATSLGRRQLRKQFCASLAQASFHTAWVIRASLTVRGSLPVYPDKQTFSEPVGMSQR